MTTWTQLAVEHVGAISKEDFSTSHRGKSMVMSGIRQSIALIRETVRKMYRIPVDASDDSDISDLPSP